MASRVGFASALAVAACGVCACGGGAAPQPAPQLPPTVEALPSEGQPASSASANSTAPIAPPVGSQSSPQEVVMKPPVTSVLSAELRAIGLDPTRLPPIERLEPRALRAVMKLMAKSLGVRCAECHEESDFAAPTPRKHLAAHMWDEFVVKLKTANGEPVFCDSCHQGRLLQLDRRDRQALSTWMTQNFVARLSRADGKTHDCETCHVDPSMRILDKWEN